MSHFETLKVMYQNALLEKRQAESDFNVAKDSFVESAVYHLKAVDAKISALLCDLKNTQGVETYDIFKKQKYNF